MRFLGCESEQRKCAWVVGCSTTGIGMNLVVYYIQNLFILFYRCILEVQIPSVGLFNNYKVYFVT